MPTEPDAKVIYQKIYNHEKLNDNEMEYVRVALAEFVLRKGIYG